MAYITARPNGSFELRRSCSTPGGPRSETLASFRVLTAAVAERAVARSGGAVTADEVRDAARRAGAPVALDPARRPAAELIAALAGGASLPAGWRPVLAGLLEGEEGGGDADAIGQWAEASPERRGDALRDLLLLTDAIPRRKRAGELSFPAIRTAGP